MGGEKRLNPKPSGIVLILRTLFLLQVYPHSGRITGAPETWNHIFKHGKKTALNQLSIVSYQPLRPSKELRTLWNPSRLPLTLAGLQESSTSWRAPKYLLFRSAARKTLSESFMLHPQNDESWQVKKMQFMAQSKLCCWCSFHFWRCLLCSTLPYYTIMSANCYLLMKFWRQPVKLCMLEYLVVDNTCIAVSKRVMNIIHFSLGSLLFHSPQLMSSSWCVAVLQCYWSQNNAPPRLVEAYAVHSWLPLTDADGGQGKNGKCHCSVHFERLSQTQTVVEHICHMYKVPWSIPCLKGKVKRNSISRTGNNLWDIGGLL